MSIRPYGSPNVRPAVCPTGTPAARHGVVPGVACRVQNQNQNQSVLTAVCGSFDQDRIRSNGGSDDIGIGATR